MRSVCFILGPIRNLATLGVMALAFHPNCQVLLHGARIFYDEELLRWLVMEDQANFLDFILMLGLRSTQTNHPANGGNVLVSELFTTREDIMDKYKTMYGNHLFKSDIHCLLWKEPVWMTNFLRNKALDFDLLFGWNPYIRFLLPIRNPLNCTYSNLWPERLDSKLFHYPFLAGKNDASILTFIMETIEWFLILESKHPDRFFTWFIEQDFNKDSLLDLALFLELKQSEKWVGEVLSLFQVKKIHSYEWSESLMEDYQEFLRRPIFQNSSIKRRMENFLEEN